MKTPLDCIMERENNTQKQNMVRLSSLNHKINRKAKQMEEIRLVWEDMENMENEDYFPYFPYKVLEEGLEKALVFFEETVKTPVGGTVHRYPDDAWDAFWEDPNPEASYWF